MVVANVAKPSSHQIVMPVLTATMAIQIVVNASVILTVRRVITVKQLMVNVLVRSILPDTTVNSALRVILHSQNVKVCFGNKLRLKISY